MSNAIAVSKLFERIVTGATFSPAVRLPLSVLIPLQQHLQHVLGGALDSVLAPPREVSTSTSCSAKFQSVLRKPGTTSRLLTRENIQEWQQSHYDLKVGQQLVQRAAAEAADARKAAGKPQRVSNGQNFVDAEDELLQKQAASMVRAVQDLEELRVVVQEIGVFMDSYCLVAAISRIPRLCKMRSPSAPGALRPTTALSPAEHRVHQQQLAHRVLDHLLLQLHGRLHSLDSKQLAILVFALGELSYGLAPEQLKTLLPHILRATANPELLPRDATSLMLGCAKLHLDTAAPTEWAHITAAVARMSLTMDNLQCMAAALKALCLVKQGSAQNVGHGDAVASTAGEDSSEAVAQDSTHNAIVEAAAQHAVKALLAIEGADDSSASATEATPAGRSPGIPSATVAASHNTDSPTVQAQLTSVAHVMRSLAKLGSVPAPLLATAARVLSVHAAALPPMVLLTVLCTYVSKQFSAHNLYAAVCTSAAHQCCLSNSWHAKLHLRTNPLLAPNPSSSLPISAILDAMQCANLCASGTVTFVVLWQKWIQSFAPEQVHSLIHLLPRIQPANNALVKLAADMLLIHGPGRDADRFAFALQRLTTMLGPVEPSFAARSEAQVVAATTAPSLTAEGILGLIAGTVAVYPAQSLPPLLVEAFVAAATRLTSAAGAPAGASQAAAAVCQLIAALQPISGAAQASALLALADRVVAMHGTSAPDEKVRSAMHEAADALEAAGLGQHPLVQLAG